MAVHNLPHHATPFVGRLAEIAQIASRLNDPNCRLLTLVGPGGIGKTRLAVQVASQLSNSFANGVYFVPLQPLNSVDFMISAIADSLGFQFSSGGNSKQQMLDYFRDKALLLVLDNLEHLADGAGLLSEIVHSAPYVSILATSRERLSLLEEWAFDVRELNYPLSESETDIEAYDAVQLFLQHARKAQTALALTTLQKPAVIRICRLVGGMPLGIELAAAWVRALSYEEIAHELEHSLDILESPARNIEPRHHTMRAAIEPTWAGLSDVERDVFKKLSVFQGGFNREAAEHIAGASLHSLSALVNRSLVRMDRNGRYDLHELLRQFAEEKLREFPEEKAAVRDRHAAYYVAFLHSLTRHMRNEGEYDALQAIEQELDNVRACWEYAIEQVDVVAFRKCEEVLRVFYHVQDRFYEGERVFGRAAAALKHAEPGKEREVTFALLLIGQGKCCLRLGQHERAKEMLETSVAILRHYNLSRELGWALYDLSRILHEREEFREATQVEQESLALGEAVGDDALIAWSYYELSYTVRMYGDYADSLHFIQQSLLWILKTGDEDGIGLVLRGLADRLRERGEYWRAKQFFQQAVEIHRKLDYKTKLASSLEGVGNNLFALGGYEQARVAIEESLAIARDLGFPRRLAFSLINLGSLFHALGHLEKAEGMFHESLMIATKIAEPWQQALSLKGLGRIAFSRKHYTDARQFFQESLSINQRIEFFLEIAVNLSDLGRVAVALGNTLEARGLFRDALNVGLKIQLAPVFLESIARIAELFLAEGNPVRTVPLLTMILSHDASHHETKKFARQLLKSMEAEHSTQMIPSERRRGTALTLETTVSELLAEFTTAPEQLPAHIDQHQLLNPRELVVLRLIADGMSNREIAEELIFSIGTVKWYVHQIYSKLGVGSRTQAVARAKELNLLS